VLDGVALPDDLLRFEPEGLDPLVDDGARRDAQAGMT